MSATEEDVDILERELADEEAAHLKTLDKLKIANARIAELVAACEAAMDCIGPPCGIANCDQEVCSVYRQLDSAIKGART